MALSQPLAPALAESSRCGQAATTMHTSRQTLVPHIYAAHGNLRLLTTVALLQGPLLLQPPQPNAGRAASPYLPAACRKPSHLLTSACPPPLFHCALHQHATTPLDTVPDSFEPLTPSHCCTSLTIDEPAHCGLPACDKRLCCCPLPQLLHKAAVVEAAASNILAVPLYGVLDLSIRAVLVDGITIHLGGNKGCDAAGSGRAWFKRGRPNT